MELESWSPARRWWYGARLAVGLGWLAAAGELLLSLMGPALPMSLADGLLLGLAAGVVVGLVAGLLGLAFGAVHTAVRSGARTDLGLQLGLVAAALAAAEEGPRLFVLSDERPVAAAMMALFIPIAGVLTYGYARILLARQERAPTPVGWLAVSGGLLALVILGTAVGRVVALPVVGGDCDGGLLITVDGLRADELGVMARVSAWPGVRFQQAISPTTDAAAAQATVITGAHPLRHGMIEEGDRIGPGMPSLAARFADAGCVTAAFVSRGELAVERGFGRGFDVYDSPSGWPRGGDRLGLAARLLPSAGEARADGETLAAARAWLGAVQGGRFAWIHLADLGSSGAARPDRLAAVEQALMVAEGERAAITGTVGLLLDDHGGEADRRVPWEQVVHVPLLILGGASGEVQAQVRLQDVGATLLALAGLEPQLGEGVDLSGYADGTRQRSMWTSLLGSNPDGGPILGLRQEGVKYLYDVHADSESLYDLRVDPGELHDLASEQPAALAQVRALVQSDLAALKAREEP